MAKRYENMDNVSTKINSLFLRWRKERKQNKNFSFLVEQSPVKQSAFLQSNVEKRLSHGLGIPLFLSKRMDLIY